MVSIEDFIEEHKSISQHVQKQLHRDFLMNDQESRELIFTFLDAYRQKHPDHTQRWDYMERMNRVMDRFFSMHLKTAPYMLFKDCKVCTIEKPQNTKHVFHAHWDAENFDLYNCVNCGNTVAHRYKSDEE